MIQDQEYIGYIRLKESMDPCLDQYIDHGNYAVYRASSA